MKKIIVFLIVALIIFVKFIEPYEERKAKKAETDTAIVAENVEEPDSAPEIVNAVVGETVTFDGLDFTVLNFGFSDYILGIEGGKEAGNSNKYCNIEVSIFNPQNKICDLTNGKISQNSKYNYILVFDEEYNYYSSWIYGYYNFLMYFEDIKPLETITAFLCFEVPDQVANGSESLALSLMFNSAFETDQVDWVLRYEK